MLVLEILPQESEYFRIQAKYKQLTERILQHLQATNEQMLTKVLYSKIQISLSGMGEQLEYKLIDGFVDPSNTAVVTGVARRGAAQVGE